MTGHVQMSDSVSGPWGRDAEPRSRRCPWAWRWPSRSRLRRRKPWAIGMSPVVAGLRTRLERLECPVRDRNRAPGIARA